MTTELEKIIGTSKYLERLVKKYMRKIPIEEKWICEEALHHLELLTDNYEELKQIELTNQILQASKHNPPRSLLFDLNNNYKC